MSSVFSNLLQFSVIFPSIKVFSSESVLRIRWPKYWSFSISVSPSNEYSGLISFRMDWMDLLAVQGTLKSLPTPQIESINSSALSWGQTISPKKKNSLQAEKHRHCQKAASGTWRDRQRAGVATPWLHPVIKTKCGLPATPGTHNPSAMHTLHNRMLSSSLWVRII